MHIIIGIVVYAVICALLISTLLCGEKCPAFSGIPWLHTCLTESLPSCASSCARRVAGARGDACLRRVVGYVFYEPNPILQLSYLAMLSAGFGLFSLHVFTELPVPGVPVVHVWSGTAVVLLCLVTFVAASTTDAGEITSRNLALHSSMYAYDGITNAPHRLCFTCGIERPARSKHDAVLNTCIARYDHFCPWLNNAVGLRNTRFFMGFVAANGVMAVYGAALDAAVLQHRLTTMWGIHRLHYQDPHTHVFTPLLHNYAKCTAWVVAHEPLRVMLLLLCLVVSLMMGAFFCYHLFLMAANTTTYEEYKRRLVSKAPPRAYSRGLLENTLEVLLPERVMHAAEARNACTSNTRTRNGRRGGRKKR